jgi:hypothetical protein
LCHTDKCIAILTDGLHPKLAKPHPKELLIGHTITGVLERERPDTGTVRRPRAERQPTGAAAPEGTAGGVQEAGSDREGGRAGERRPATPTAIAVFLVSF